MEKYSIFCSEEQTRKAMALGAPIRKKVYPIEILNKCNLFSHHGQIRIIPTTEEMIGWLEEQKTITAINIDYYVTGNAWACWIKFKEGTLNKQDFSSRKEATLAAIDAALDYLEKQNVKK